MGGNLCNQGLSNLCLNILDTSAGKVTTLQTFRSTTTFMTEYLRPKCKANVDSVSTRRRMQGRKKVGLGAASLLHVQKPLGCKDDIACVYLPFSEVLRRGRRQLLVCLTLTVGNGDIVQSFLIPRRPQTLIVLTSRF